MHTAPDHPNLLYDLLGLLHAGALADFTDHIRIHAGCAEHGGRRFIVIGDKGAGKSTLMMRLLFDGHRVDGDELILVKDGKVTPFPRRFLIKEGSLGLLPELRPLVPAVPRIRLYNGARVYSFSPQEAGYPWKIETRPADAVFYLEPNHNGRTRIEPYPKYRMAEKLMARSFLSESEDHLKIGGICEMVDGSACYRLRVGNLAGAAASIREALSAV